MQLVVLDMRSTLRFPSYLQVPPGGISRCHCPTVKENNTSGLENTFLQWLNFDHAVGNRPPKEEKCYDTDVGSDCHYKRHPLETWSDCQSLFQCLPVSV